MEKLTSEEAQVYDRQIRLWGVEAQQKLRKARVLMVGMSSLANEVAKNILLAGIYRLHLLDEQTLSQDDWGLQFMATRDKMGQNKCDAYLQRCKELNPMVEVVAEAANVSSKDDEFFKDFDVVCMCSGSLLQQIKINEVCHRLGVKFFSGAVFGYYGYMFADLIQHTYAEEQVKVVKTSEPEAKKQKIDDDPVYEEKVADFCSLESALSAKFLEGKSARQTKQVSKTYLMMQVLLEYEKQHNSLPPVQIKSLDEQQLLLEVRDCVMEKMAVDSELLSDKHVNHSRGNLYAVNPVVGGVLAQEIIKAVSGRDTPHNNFFFYDALNTGGVVEKVAPNNTPQPSNGGRPKQAEVVL